MGLGIGASTGPHSMLNAEHPFPFCPRGQAVTESSGRVRPLLGGGDLFRPDLFSSEASFLENLFFSSLPVLTAGIQTTQPSD